MNRLISFFRTITASPFRIAVSISVVLIMFGLLRSEQSADTANTAYQPPVVTLTTAQEFAGITTLNLVGTVRATAEADVTAERTGRVTNVPVTLGQTVSAGTVIATLENAGEQAAVLQAEGVYEAALAASAQSGVSVSQAQTALMSAKQNAVATYQSSYNTVNGLIRNSVDQFFSDPDARVPGLRLDGNGLTAHLNSERVAYQTLLTDWQTQANTLTNNDDLHLALRDAQTHVNRTIALLDTFLTLFNNQGNTSRYTDTELQGFITSFTAQRANLIEVRTRIDNAVAGLNSADDGLRRAELAASGGTTSAADAQVKQALGTLRAAQANLAKTILRSPIAGTINTLAIRTGDFTNANTSVAKVANNTALEIVTYISERERDRFMVGDTVMIENTYEGHVTQIAPAVDEVTHKIEVRIATADTTLTTGDTVRITKQTEEIRDENSPIEIPLAAIKFEAENGSVFLLDEQNTLTARPVTLGAIHGGAITILAGLSADESFVADARGLVAGTLVTVQQ